MSQKKWPRRRKIDLLKVVVTAPVPIVNVIVADKYGRKWWR